MIRCYRLGMLLGELPLLALLGCASLDRGGLPLASGTPPAAPVARGQMELPPGQAAEACLATARVMDNNGHEAEAIAQYERARHYNPRLTWVCRRLAVLYERQGDYGRAVSEYQKAVNLHPRDADLLNDVGYFYYQCGNPDEAVTLLRQAIGINPRCQRAWINLGMALAELGKNQECLDAFSRVVTLPEAYSNLGFLLAKKGNTEEARLAFRYALNLQPNQPKTRAALARLEKMQPAGMASRPLPGRGDLIRTTSAEVASPNSLPQDPDRPNDPLLQVKAR